MVSCEFQQRVDVRLARLEVADPSLARMRRVPIDLIAHAVEKEGLQVPDGGSLSWWYRAWLWVTRTSLSDRVIDQAILSVATRNGFGPPRRTLNS